MKKRTFGEKIRTCPKRSTIQHFNKKFDPAYDFKLKGLKLGRNVVRCDGQVNARNVLGVCIVLFAIQMAMSALFMNEKPAWWKWMPILSACMVRMRAALGAYMNAFVPARRQ